MIKIGKYNRLPVVKTVDFGVYLDGGNGVEILLPARYVTEPVQPGDELEVFIYTDSEDRLIATTERPLIAVGEFAYLRAVEVNRIGAFMDWGLPKDLLCPYREQRIRMVPSGEYLVYAYLDDTTKRIVASARSRISRQHDSRLSAGQSGVGTRVAAHRYRLSRNCRQSFLRDAVFQ